jgi:molecular chaperone GrpE
METAGKRGGETVRGEEVAVKEKKGREKASGPEREEQEEGAVDERADRSSVPAEPLVPEGEEEEEEERPREESEAEVLQNELALLETQLHNMRDRYIRAVADLDNARKRARQAIGEARVQAVAAVLRDVLTLVDNFERALETAQPTADAPAETRAVYEGVALIYRQLMEMWERQGVAAIEAVGRPFDPTRHEAVAQIPASEKEKEGRVALEMQKGYMLGDRVLRPSKVGVVVHEAEGKKQKKDVDEG